MNLYLLSREFKSQSDKIFSVSSVSRARKFNRDNIKILCPVYLFWFKKISSKKEPTLKVIFFAVSVSKNQSKFQTNTFL